MALRTGEHGVKAADLAAQRAALLARCDQRAKREQYVRGLLLEGRRKSIQPMAARLTDGDEQGFAAVHFPASAHTHNHLDDAVEQGELFANVFE